MLIVKVIKRLLRTKSLSSILLRPMLNLHNFSYEMIGHMAKNVNGEHPKHQIIKYFEWFKDQISKNDVVLDVGCNKGYMVSELSTKAQFVYGIEIDQKLCEEAVNQYQGENIKFICADATKYDFSSLLSVDVVTLSNVLEHIDGRVGFLRSLKDSIKWKNGPRFLIRVPLIEREWLAVFKKQVGVEWRLDKTHFTEYYFEELEEEIANAGLTVLNKSSRFGEAFVVCEGVES